MIALKIFTEEGIHRFTENIHNVRNDPATLLPDLNTEPYSLEFQPSIYIDENKTFATRMDMASYLSERFRNASVSRENAVGLGKEGLWTWLAYLWFDQITDQRRYVGRTERYVCSSDWNRYYVHLIAGAYQIFVSLGEDGSRLFLCSEPFILNDFNDHMACYQYIVGYPNIIKVAHTLYWDENTRRPKRGSQTTKNPGNLRRFSKFISQIELTYDVYSMKCDDILNLLPNEFDRWKTG
jgi:hypothetical protein